MQYLTALSIISATSALSIASEPVTGLTPLCNQPGQLCELDSQKYLGSWFEIGSTAIIKNFVQKDCECVTANYVLNNPLEIGVTNTCVNSKIKEPVLIRGTAKILSSSELKVDFGVGNAPGSQNGGDEPNYVVKNVWVDEHGNYQRSLVTSPLRPNAPAAVQFTWILSRTPTITPAEVDEILQYAVASGYSPKEAGFSATEQVSCRN
ncbi:hypothetical protein HDV02_006339 [Globomyces sp. JEL0801]|nr:hypothetical protein HDV02_006339 [Globomyces sp. JEL0801]